MDARADCNCLFLQRNSRSKILQNVYLTTMADCQKILRLALHWNRKIHVWHSQAALLQHVEHYRAFKRCVAKHDMEKRTSYYNGQRHISLSCTQANIPLFLWPVTKQFGYGSPFTVLQHKEPKRIVRSILSAPLSFLFPFVSSYWVVKGQGNANNQLNFNSFVAIAISIHFEVMTSQKSY